jgi:hypothetical protein
MLWTFKHGVRNLFYRIFNKNMFEIPVLTDFPVGNTSVADGTYVPTFPSLCGLAARDESIFIKFRRSKVMFDVLDHVSIDQGNEYISEILKRNEWSDKFTKAINHVDMLGSPRKYRFDRYGTFSSTLLRYLKVHLDLQFFFGPLSRLNIVEIGGGFGGQASLTSLLDTPLSQSIYDIPPVLELTKKFITNLQVPGNFIFNDGRAPVPSKPDLIISNYAFCELNRSIQDIYLKNIIIPARRGYITWNSLSADNFGVLSAGNLNGYSLAELIRVIPNSQILPEVPLTSPNNAIIMWNNSN